MHKARAAVSSPPSAPLNGITELFDKSLPTSMERVYGEGNLCAGDPVSHHHRLRTECARPAASCSCARSVIRATRSQCGVPQLALRAYAVDALEDRSGTRPRFVERGYPTKAIITIPITLYGYGNGDDAEEGVPRGGLMGGSMESTSATKGRRCSRAAWNFRR
jgi:hypothetical protein